MANEDIPGPVVTALRDRGHDVLSVKEAMRGANDRAVLRRAEVDERVLVTCDKDFGELCVLGRVVKPSESVRQIAADPADDRVLEAALEGKAGVIISGDRHLLRLRSWRGIRILSPSDFIVDQLT